jgi:hypothetical protein
VFQTPKIARHVAVDKRDPDACIDRKPAVVPSEQLGGGTCGLTAPGSAIPLTPAEIFDGTLLNASAATGSRASAVVRDAETNRSAAVVRTAVVFLMGKPPVTIFWKPLDV